MPTIFIPGPLPGLNDHEKAARGNRYAAAGLKKRWTERVMYECCAAKLDGLMLERVHLSFVWIEKNKRRDPSNVAFAKKYVEDGLVCARVIAGDGWSHVASFSDSWQVGPFPGVHVVITPIDGTGGDNGNQTQSA